MISLESKILNKMHEPFAAGFYEERNAPVIKKYSRAILRYFESVIRENCIMTNEILFPSGQTNVWQQTNTLMSFHFDYSFSARFNSELFQDKIDKYLDSDREKVIAQSVAGDLLNYCFNPMSSKYAVGGKGFTHSILNYGKILHQGLPVYAEAIKTNLANADSIEKRDFYEALQETFDAIMLFMNYSADATGNHTLETLVRRAPETFREAMILFNFIYYIDGCDSIGSLDVFLSPFFKKDIADKVICDKEVMSLLERFFENVDANNGWHMILGGGAADKKLTELCLRAVKTRRPNSGIKISAATSDDIWNAAFDSLAGHTGNPAFYNDDIYRQSAVELADIASDDLENIAYGGCTEFMIAGKSNIGSIDSGINLLEILDGELKGLKNYSSFEAFLDRFKQDISNQIDRVIAETNLNQQYKAMYRPQLIRSLFIDDCINCGIEYNSGGADYNGGVINVAGIANTANSLYVLKQVFDGKFNISQEELGRVLDVGFAGRDDVRQLFKQLPKFGNAFSEVDNLARDICDFSFNRILKARCWRGDGFYLPSTIMFTTYVSEGLNIEATPDGRKAGDAISDSCGPVQGTDIKGVTSMLNSTSHLPQAKGLGTMVLNMRIRSEMVKQPVLRAKLKSLILSYFEMGGMQVQITVLDSDLLKDALEHPEMYESLVIRIGGYTEYFHRIDDDLKQEIIKRTVMEIQQ